MAAIRLEVCMAEGWQVWEGTTVDGKFRLEEFLGGSDHSAVFRTLADGRPASIKFVPATPANLDLQRTSWEAASRFAHPNLLRLLGTGRCQLGSTEFLYLVMEFAEENLGQIVPQRALTADETRELLPPVLDGLGYLHQAGFAHTALKPSNVLAARDQLKLSIDQVRTLGKAKAAGEPSPYDAPETANGNATAASDVYSLGALLSETLTQHTPARNGASSSLPDPFGDIVSHCLDQDPSRRWTIAQIKQRLSGKSVPKPVATPSLPASKSSLEPAADETASAKSGSRSLVIAGITFLLVLLAIYGGSRLFHGSAATSSSGETTKSAETRAAPAPSSTAPAQPSTSAPSRTAPVPSAEAGVLERVEPDVSGSARATITGKIRVRVGVTVAPDGTVSDAHLLTSGPSQYFSSRALTAARKWKFTPPQINGQPAESHWTLLFGFTRKGTSLDATPVSR